MKKITAFLLLFLISTLSTTAQKIIAGDILKIPGGSTFYTTFDFSTTTVAGQPFEDFIEIKAVSDSYTDTDIDELKRDIISVLGQFIEEFNDNADLLKLSVRKKNDLQLTIVIKEMSRKGNSADCDYIFSRSNSTDPLLVISMTTKEGRFGSFTNLMGDVFREAGENLANFMTKALKSSSKKKTKDSTDPIYDNI